MSTRAAVLGTGSWGTAFAATMADSGSTVHMWGRRQEVVDQVNAGSNTSYLPGIELPRGFARQSTPRRRSTGPRSSSSRCRRRLCGATSRAGPAPPARRGGRLADEGHRARHDQADERGHRGGGGVDAHRIVVVSGPNLAREIAERQPAASVVACLDEATAERVATSCVTPWFRPYTNADVIGIELGGAVKNVVALAVGMAAGMGMGDNSKASSSPAGWPRRRGSVRPGSRPGDLHGPGRRR